MSGWPRPRAGRAGRFASPGSWGDRPLLGMVLRMHGHELRKAGHSAAGTTRLRQALQVDDDPARQGAGLLLFARAAAESGQRDPAGRPVLGVGQLGVRVQITAELDQLGLMLIKKHTQIREQISVCHDHHPPVSRTCRLRTR